MDNSVIAGYEKCINLACPFINENGYCMSTVCVKGLNDFNGTYYVNDNESGYILSKPEIGDQKLKKDADKLRLSLVPRQIIFDVAKIREYGVTKYGDSDSWKKVSLERYRDAAFRHFLAYLDNPDGVDEESGLSHLAHLACNIAFLCQLEKEKNNGID